MIPRRTFRKGLTRNSSDVLLAPLLAHNRGTLFA